MYMNENPFISSSINPSSYLLEPGMTCNRETVAKQMHKTMTVTSVDFAEISDMIGDSELIEFDERLAMARWVHV